MPLRIPAGDCEAMNLTPMIDVLFLLIIFFVAGTRFTEQERNIDLDLPSVAEHDGLAETPRERAVEVARDGGIRLDGTLLTLSDLEARLRELRAREPRAAVVVRGDGQGTYQPVAEVMNVCRRAGIANLAMAVRTRPDGPR